MGMRMGVGSGGGLSGRGYVDRIPNKYGNKHIWKQGRLRSQENLCHRIIIFPSNTLP